MSLASGDFSVITVPAVNFKPKDAIGQLLGFTLRVLQANKTHISDLPVAILKINALRGE